jgi:hypothetical protein
MEEKTRDGCTWLYSIKIYSVDSLPFSAKYKMSRKWLHDTKSFERECLIDTDFSTFLKNGKMTHSFHSNPVLLPKK